MEVEVKLIIESYKNEINRLINDNILLRAQVKQIQNELNQLKGCDNNDSNK